jgi:hypothetical protein
VRDHLITELKKLDSFQRKDYDQALKDIYLKMDEMLLTAYGREKLKTYNKKNA